MNRHSNRSLSKLFRSFANEENEFDKTTIVVKLTVQIDGYVSRSQAKRLLFGLEQYQRIVLDFVEVAEVGQGFIDEIFHVFHARHPKIQIEAINTNHVVAFMIARVKKR